MGKGQGVFVTVATRAAPVRRRACLWQPTAPGTAAGANQFPNGVYKGSFTAAVGVDAVVASYWAALAVFTQRNGNHAPIIAGQFPELNWGMNERAPLSEVKSSN